MPRSSRHAQRLRIVDARRRHGAQGRGSELAALFLSGALGALGVVAAFHHALVRNGVNIIHIDIIRSLPREIAFFQLFVYLLVDRGIDDHEHRHAQQHPPEAEQPCAEDDGEHDPEAVDADGAAEYFRSYDIAVKLLEDNDEDDEHKALERVDKQDDERARHGADERTEKRYHVRHAHNDAHQQCIRHIQQRTADVADKPYDGGVEKLAVYKPGEGAVCERETAADLLRRFNGEEAVQPALGVGGERLVVCKDVDGDDDADDEVVYRHHNVVHARCQIRHEAAQLRQDGGLYPVGQSGVYLADDLHGILLDLRVVLQ